MQLNSLTLNPNKTPPQSKSQLAIYDHKLVRVNTSIFVYGKNFFNFTIQTPLHKINLQTLTSEPVYTLNPPLIEDFMIFSFQQNIYFWGKSVVSQKNELFQFDGSKFAKMDQNGSIPHLGGSYSFTKFSEKYLLMFGYLPQDQFQNKWYIFDIKKLLWKPVISNIQIPVCQKSQMIWANGRGYLLLRSTYDKKKKTYRKNVLYEIKFRSFSQLSLECTQIQFSASIREQNLIFTDLIYFNDRQLIILGGQQFLFSCFNEKQHNSKLFQSYEHKDLSKITDQISEMVKSSSYQKSDFKQQNNGKQQSNAGNTHQHKKVYGLDLQSLEWSSEPEIIPIKGQNLEIIAFNYKIYTVGGTLGTDIFSQIQCYDFKSQQSLKSFPYEQSLCYQCECAFTYTQGLMYQPLVESEYEKFCPKSRIQNKFLRKLSQSINTQLHAIGIVCQFLHQLNAQSIQVNLFQYVQPPSNIQLAKLKVQTIMNQVLCFKGKTQKSPEQKVLTQLFSNQQSHSIDTVTLQNFHVNFVKLKIASFKLGYGLLYVESTEQGSVLVGYCSYSQTQFPETNYRSFSQTFYTLKVDKSKNTVNYSSENKRKIIFENVKLHFGNPIQYQNIQKLMRNKSKGQANNFVHVYIIGTTNLQKSLSIQNNYLEDIQVKSLNKKNPFNSLRTYMKHLYLSSNNNFKFSLENKTVQLINIFDKFEQLTKSKAIIEIPSIEQIPLKKTQFEQTHFSTNQDEIIVSWKKLEIVDKCRFYQINENHQNSISSIYQNIFVYHNRKLVKNVSTKKSMICGVIELTDNLDLKLNGGDFVSISDERQFLRWIEQIENNLIDEMDIHKEDL